MYRPAIKVIDCTIRDGGLMNKSKFSLEIVQKVYEAVCQAGVDYVELGYRNSKSQFSPDVYGPWRFCDEDMLKRVVGDKKYPTKVAVMQDAHKASAEDVLPREQSVVDMVRVATYVKDIDKAILLVNSAAEKGYETTINIMAVSHALDRELDEALQQIEQETKVHAVYIVDSYGALYSEDIDYLVHKFQRYLKTKQIGIHAHNQQQLAYANTIESIIKNANYLDATLFGLGRAAGNCPLELLIGFLKNPKFDIRPLLKVIGSHIVPLQKEIPWGYHIPYMVSGMLNIHPLEALELMDLPDTDEAKFDYAKFYDQMAGGGERGDLT